MKLWVTVAAVSVASMAALAPASQAAAVCNVRENSHQHYSVNGQKVTEAMQVGKGKAKGLTRAAQNSPALELCPSPSPNPGQENGGGSSGGGATGGGSGGSSGGGSTGGGSDENGGGSGIS